MDATQERIEPLYVPPCPPCPLCPQHHLYNPSSPTFTHQHTQGDIYPANGGPSYSWRPVIPSVTQPSLTAEPTDESRPPPTHTSKHCSIILCSNSGTQRYPATSLGALEIRRERNGIKTTDKELFLVLRKIYYERLRPPFQRSLSVRALKRIVIVECTNDEDPVPLLMNASLRRDLIHVFHNPNLISTEDKWVNFICGLGEDPHHNYGLLFLDDWDAQKIAVLVGVPLIISILTAILWIARTGDIQAAMAVSSYILSATGVVLGLLAVLGTIET